MPPTTYTASNWFHPKEAFETPVAAKVRWTKEFFGSSLIGNDGPVHITAATRRRSDCPFRVFLYGGEENRQNKEINVCRDLYEEFIFSYRLKTNDSGDNSTSSTSTSKRSWSSQSLPHPVTPPTLPRYVHFQRRSASLNYRAIFASSCSVRWVRQSYTVSIRALSIYSVSVFKGVAFKSLDHSIIFCQGCVGTGGLSSHMGGSNGLECVYAAVVIMCSDTIATLSGYLIHSQSADMHALSQTHNK